MTTRKDPVQALKEQVAEFASASAELRVLESDVSWCTAEGRTPGPNLLEQLDAAQDRWRRAHTRVFRLIDDLALEVDR
ncbi:hypothetical protein Q7C18_07330 [Nesterenkonia sp. CL21]|uniref:hypothetical protein n=1 Tax=Nesterenkonia sp. CL21 TaxID=3064894 RepID=UPI00287A36CD|nr:hypothetical protein [Nesterenkonia sp. CL21]MDS2172500.1 hypothetical protein [Nesterenkonia sp. CL21]